MYGDDNNDSSSPPPQTEQTQEGAYRTVANAVNSGVTSSTNAIEIVVAAEQFTIDIFGQGPDTTHQQFLHLASRCPVKDDDKNGDGVIDAVEGAAVYGPPILALDSELAQTGGSFPVGVTYHYNESESLAKILSNSGQTALQLPERVITIQGVPDATPLPATAQGARTEFPTACGILHKI
jgi:hypothetical protein